jgi:molybdenum cofactor synthesis domain-containing protein
MNKDIQFDYLDFEESINRTRVLHDKLKPKIGTRLTETVNSVGEILAERINSRNDVPPFNMAFYDGYALRSEDVKDASEEKPVKVKVVGKLYPDEKPSKFSLKKCEAVYVPSGAPLPLGADALIRYEDVEIDNESALITSPVEPLDRVILQGEDIKRGEIVFEKGHIIRPQDIGLLLQICYSRVKVFRRPRIGLLSVGDEILNKFEADRLSYPDNYFAIIKSFLEVFKFDVVHLGVSTDDSNEIKKIVERACSEYDSLLIISGASLGDNDSVHATLQDIGQIIFHGVRVSPGKVTGVASVNNHPVFMVPGHVGSLYVCLCFYVMPTLFGALGVQEPFLRLKAKSASNVQGRPRMSTIRPVQLIENQGEYSAKIVERRLGGSGLLTLLTKANGLIVIPPEKEVKQGDNLKVYVPNPYEIFSLHKRS